jgi:hypothetical protein
MAHWSIYKLYLAAASLQFFNEQDLMHIFARETIWGSYDHPIEIGTADLLSEPIEAWATQARSTVSIIAKDMLLLPRPSLRLTVIPYHLQLLLDCLGLGLPLGRHPDIHSNPHFSPPVLPSGYSIGQDIDTFDPIEAAHPPSL